MGRGEREQTDIDKFEMGTKLLCYESSLCRSTAILPCFVCRSQSPISDYSEEKEGQRELTGSCREDSGANSEGSTDEGWIVQFLARSIEGVGVENSDNLSPHC